MSQSSPRIPTVQEFGISVDRWIAENGPGLHDTFNAATTLADEIAYVRKLFRQLWESGYSRWGWPTVAGGHGGSVLLRAVLAERLALAELAPTMATMPEVLAAPIAAVADEELVATYLSRYLRGQDWWCQGFSEPDAGSDLAALTTRAVRDGSEYVINGQKIWTTLAQFAQRCVLLVRTGPSEAAHRSLSLFLVDMDSPGITIRPIEASTGELEFSEVFFSDVRVPSNRLVGAENKAWPIVMNVLACERSTVFWGRVAWMQHRLTALANTVPQDILSAKAIGECYQLIMSLRARSRATQYAVASGEFDAAASSIDKVLMATAEQALFDTAAELLGEAVIFGDEPTDRRLRRDVLFSRVATVYGGTAEIQRNIISQRLLGMPVTAR
jgi:alkylation response protein AidB-like acyl-CoA dehydrogenase